MSEKTAEEKLRQALEGNITSDSGQKNSQEHSQKHIKPRTRTRTKSQSLRSEKQVSLVERADSFMDDFERRIEQSLNAVKSPSEHKISTSKPKPSRKTETIRDEIYDTPHGINTAEKTPPEFSSPSIADLERAISPEITQEITPEITPEVEPPDPEPELPDIPVIEADFNSVPDTQNIDDPEGNLPDIPVISADGEYDELDSTDFDDDFPPDINYETDNDSVIDDDSSPDDVSPDYDLQPDDVPVDDDTDEKTAAIDFQEAELFDAPENEDEYAEISESDNFTPPDDFTPPADVVVSVDDELPGISETDTADYDPESESVPVSVTMPESTKTAEDKLMADIAEAMTGNPLSLDSQEAHAYNIPENFFTDGANNGDSPKSAEDKLKANIVQALSESPINTAQDQARQNLEEDINPFDDTEVPDTFLQGGDDLHPEDITGTETLQPETVNDDELAPDFAPVSEPETEAEYDALNDPFTIPDFGDDDTETESPADFGNDTALDSLSGFENDTETESLADFENNTDSEALTDFKTDTETESLIDFENDTDSESLIDFGNDSELPPDSEPSVTDDDTPFPVSEPEDNPPLTEQEALEREISAVTQEFEPEDRITDNDFDTDTLQEEAQPENNMPEESLLNDSAPENFTAEDTNDDWDISSLGELGGAATLGEAATFGDDTAFTENEPEDFSAVPGTVTEMITQPETGIINAPENDHKEKTMKIREKLASRKNGNQEGASAGQSKSGGLILPILISLLAVIGGLILWQLMQVSDKITSLAMNSPGYESVQGAESAAPSYDYAIDFILDPNLSDRMAQRGRAGWQVVGSRRTQDSTTGQYGYEFIFMRRTPGR